MAAMQKLTDRKIQSLREPGRYSDGGGLYLAVTSAGTKKWVYLFTLNGKRREMGLGSAAARHVTLQQARDAAQEARELVRQGIDPIEYRATQKSEHANAVTFGEAAEAYIDAHSPSWRSPKSRAQWEMTMRVYAANLTAMPVRDIETRHVKAVLDPIWTKKPETASRVRLRIEAILDAAKAGGHREGENPARWRGHLKMLYPARKRLSRGHHAAMPFDDVSSFVERLRASERISARALEFLILTAARSGEVFGARWSEINWDEKVWTVPAGRMKAAREHRVPLCDRMLEILKSMHDLRDGDGGYIFAGQKKGRPLSPMAMSMLMRRMDVGHYTVHGFRSAFRDWVSERTSFASDLAEAALAHTLRNHVEAAYRRGDALERRRELMSAWEAFCDPKGDGNVVQLPSRANA